LYKKNRLPDGAVLLAKRLSAEKHARKQKEQRNCDSKQRMRARAGIYMQRSINQPDHCANKPDHVRI